MVAYTVSFMVASLQLVKWFFLSEQEGPQPAKELWVNIFYLVTAR